MKYAILYQLGRYFVLRVQKDGSFEVVADCRDKTWAENIKSALDKAEAK